jgi:uncharacterized membrane protein
MRKQLIIFFSLTTFSFSITIGEAIMLEYGSYISSSLLFITLLIVFLLYWTFYYKKEAKNLKEELNVKNEALKTMQGRMQKGEVLSIQNEHDLEKQMLELKQVIKSLENNLKEGLKSQVVAKLEEYQKKRTKQMGRLDIKG